MSTDPQKLGTLIAAHQLVDDAVRTADAERTRRVDQAALEAERVRQVEADRVASAAASAAARRNNFHRRIDEPTLTMATLAIVTVVVPALLGWFVLRGWLLPLNSGVYDDEIRGIFPAAFYTTMAGAGAIAVVAGLILVARPWTGRTARAMTGAAMGIVGLVVFLWAGSLFAGAEEASVEKLATTAFPFDDKYLQCGPGEDVKVTDSATYRTALWQVYRGSSIGHTGDGCNRLILYRGWEEVSAFNLPGGMEFQTSNLPDGTRPMYGWTPDGSSVVTAELSQVSFVAHTTGGQKVTVTLATPTDFRIT